MAQSTEFILKRNTEYLQLHPYRAIVAPKLRSQKERDRMAYGRGVPTRIRIAPRESGPARSSRSRIIWIIVGALLAVLAVCWGLHASAQHLFQSL